MNRSVLRRLLLSQGAGGDDEAAVAKVLENLEVAANDSGVCRGSTACGVSSDSAPSDSAFGKGKGSEVLAHRAFAFENLAHTVAHSLFLRNHPGGL